MHVTADLLCNLGVIIAAVVIMQVKGEGKHYADPGAGIVIGLVTVTFAARLGGLSCKMNGGTLAYISLAKTNWDLLNHQEVSNVSSGDGDLELDEQVEQENENEDIREERGYEEEGDAEEGNETPEDEGEKEWGGETQDTSE